MARDQSRGRRLARAAAWAVPLGLWGMVPLSYVSYTSFGVDVRHHDGPDRVNQQLRVQWPGDGSVWIGGDRIRRPIFEPLDRIDWGGRIFRPPVRRRPESGWNQAGFWRMDQELVNDRGWTVHSRWLAVPSWLPAGGILGTMILLARRRALRPPARRRAGSLRLR